MLKLRFLDATSIAPKPSKNTALHYAVRNANTDDGLAMTELLLEYGADVRKQNSDGNEPIHEVWRVGSFDRVSSDPTSSGFYNPTVLNLGKRVDLLRILLKHGADLNARNKAGDTLLHRFIDMHNPMGVQDIINEWSSLIDWSVKNNKGQTVIQQAGGQDAGGGFANDQISEMFKATPAVLGIYGDPNATNPSGLNAFMMAAMRGDTALVKKLAQSPKVQINAGANDDDKYTALILAVYQRRPYMVKLLLELGADPLVTDAFGNTALHRVMQLPSLAVQKEMITLLLNNEKTRKALINKQNKKGQTLFHWLVRMNKPAVLAFMVEKYGADINWNLQDENKRSALRYAQDLKRKDMVATIESKKRG